jgi:hypothetical protein
MFISFISTITILASIVVRATPIEQDQLYSNVKIVSKRDGLCLSVLSGSVMSAANGTPVVSVPCDQAITWDLHRGSGSIFMHGTTIYALDAGCNPHNNGEVKVWGSYPGLTQQT